MEFCTQNCTFGPEKQKNCTFYTKNEVFAKQFHQNVQILDKNRSFGTQKCTFGSEKWKNLYFLH